LGDTDSLLEIAAIASVFGRLKIEIVEADYPEGAGSQ
jgi:hypothetical protein